MKPNKLTQNLPKIFDCYAIIVTIIGLFVFNFFFVFFITLFLLFVSFSIHYYKKHQKPNGNIGLIILFLSLFLVSAYQQTTVKVDDIQTKDELSKKVGVIPEKRTRIYIGRTDQYFLTINNIHFSCGYAKRQYACQEVYQYHGKTATIYYKHFGKHSNIVYEISIDDKIIYQFDEQLSYWTAHSKSIKSGGYWSFALYGIPMLFFVILMIIDNRHLKQTNLITHQEIPSDNNDEWLLSLGALGAILVIVGLGWYLFNF